MFPNSNRRSFVASLSSLLGLGIASERFALGSATSTSEWDISWLDALKGKHKQVFSAVGSLNQHIPLLVVTNYLDAHLEVFGLKHPDVNTVVGITREAFPINASDALWAKYEIGRRWQIKDPATDDWATRNIYMENVAAPPGKVVGIKTLQARGTVFWQCNNSLGGIARSLAKELNQPPDAVRADLIAGFMPGVKLVPAHTFMLGLCQERGFSYESI